MTEIPTVAEIFSKNTDVKNVIGTIKNTLDAAYQHKSFRDYFEEDLNGNQLDYIQRIFEVSGWMLKFYRHNETLTGWCYEILLKNGVDFRVGKSN